MRPHLLNISPTRGIHTVYTIVPLSMGHCKVTVIWTVFDPRFSYGNDFSSSVTGERESWTLSFLLEITRPAFTWPLKIEDWTIFAYLFCLLFFISLIRLHPFRTRLPPSSLFQSTACVLPRFFRRHFKMLFSCVSCFHSLMSLEWMIWKDGNNHHPRWRRWTIAAPVW